MKIITQAAIDAAVDGIESTGYVSTITTAGTAVDNATAIHADVLAALDAASGVATVNIRQGNYKLHWTVAGDTLYAAGVRKIVIKGQGRHATRLYHANTAPCVYFDNTSRAGPKTLVSALTLALYNTDNYNYIQRITVPDASLFAKNDLVQIKTANYPEFSTGRVVGETFRVKAIDTTNDYIWVDGRLEFAESNGTSLYGSDNHVRKLDSGLVIDFVDCGFFPDGDSADQGITTRAHTIHYEAATNCNFYGCYFEAPWGVSLRFVTCGDCIAYQCEFAYGLNNPTSDQLTYGMQWYGACYNCWLLGCTFRGYRHAGTTDGYGSADTTTGGSHFSTTSGSPTVTVTRSSHGMATGDWVRFGVAAATGNNVTIGGAYQVTVLTSSTFTITAGTNANATGNFGSATAFTRFRENLWEQHGMPVYCGAQNCQASEGKGAPWDTHEEGANIQYINCSSKNCHSADEVSQFIGSSFQIRCRRSTIKGAWADTGNFGISWKPGEQGTQNWLHVYDSHFLRTTYQADIGRGIYITAGTGTLVNMPRLRLSNVTIEEFGKSIESDIAVLLETNNFSSIKPHFGHIDLADGSLMNNTNMVWDSRSANLPGATTANRTLYGVTMAGTSTCRIHGMKHYLGTDATKHTPQIFDSADNAGGKTVALTGYDEIDVSGIGPRPILEVGREADFIVEAIQCVKPRIQYKTDSGAVTMLEETDVLFVNKGTGGATTVNFKPISYKTQTVKDLKGDAVTNNITLAPTTGNIEGATTYAININRQSVTLLGNTTEVSII